MLRMPNGDSGGRREPGMPERILDTAEELVQVRGFNGFSYADIAARLMVTNANLHYHFGTKAQLGEALIARYTERFMDALARIDASGAAAPQKLAAYATLYADVLKANRLCLCGMLAAEYQTLPDPMRNAVVLFFDRNEEWLAAVLREGGASGAVHLQGTVEDAARAIVSGLEGAMLLTRPYRDVARFQATADGILAGLVHSAG